jgi:cytochrome c-type biogenesis protein CcmH
MSFRINRGFWLIVLGLALLPLQGLADEIKKQVLSPELEKRAQYLEHDLRCVTCAGQSLADSTAPLAIDLKSFVRRELIKGQSEEAIKADLVKKYGPTILARPPLSGIHLFLWFTPIILLILSSFFVVFWLKRRRISHELNDVIGLDMEEKQRFERIRQQNRDENAS